MTRNSLLNQLRIGVNVRLFSSGVMFELACFVRAFTILESLSGNAKCTVSIKALCVVHRIIIFQYKNRNRKCQVRSLNTMNYYLLKQPRLHLDVADAAIEFLLNRHRILIDDPSPLCLTGLAVLLLAF